jgi:polyphosphate kinase
MKNCYDNRELSWLKFNERVLEEARDFTVPLGERLGFAAIFQSNLDEFFMVRVGSLCECITLGIGEPDNKTDMMPEKQLEAIFKRCRELAHMRDVCYFDISSTLQERFGATQVDFRALSKKEEEFLGKYFEKEIKPLLSPQVIDKRCQFPFLTNKSIYACAHLESKSGIKLGLVAASGSFSRVIFLPTPGNIRFMLAEELILHYIPLLFPNSKINSKSLIRVTRNADISPEEGMFDHDIDYRGVMERLLRKRRKQRAVRLELSRRLSDSAISELRKQLGLFSKNQIFMQNSPLDLSFVYYLKSRLEPLSKDLYYPRYIPVNSPMIRRGNPVIPQIEARDILLSYPYESINPFLRLLDEAAEQEDVISIKITLYRVAPNSKVIEALAAAAENGKEVMALVELRARFDEENNIGWSRRLEGAGVNVIYGPESLKVHSKLLLITRKTADGVRYITQIGTGNYNEKTSKLYTDFSLMTGNAEIGENAAYVFNCLSRDEPVDKSDLLLVSPTTLQQGAAEKIDKQIKLARCGEDAFVGLKLNSLTDKLLIDKLIEASKAGVKILLAVRGICCLVAGVAGFTENIRVISIVGRFLEHSRIYLFGAGESPEVYISSADFMTRNTERRIEVAAPLLDTAIKARVIKYFHQMFEDNVKARVMRPDGTYQKRPLFPNETPVNFQEEQMNEAILSAETIRVGIRVKPYKLKRKNDRTNNNN